MIRKYFGMAVALLVLGAAAACGGNGGNAISSGSGPALPYPQSGTYTLYSNSAPNISVAGLDGQSMVIALPEGSGNVTVTTSTTVPAGLSALQAKARRNAASATASPAPAVTNAPQIYITVSAVTAASLDAHPGFSLALPAVPSQPVYEAWWNGANWVTVNGRKATVSGTVATLSSAALASPIQVAAGSSLYYAIYTGYSVPSPTPSPTPTATPTGATPPPVNVVVNGNFESGSLSGWYVCYAPHTALTASVDPNPPPQVVPEPTQSPPGTTIGQTIETPTTDAAVSTTVPNGSVLGSYSALVSHFAADVGRSKGLIGICQDVDVPTNNPTLTLQVYEGGNVTSINGSDTEADIFSGVTWVPSTSPGGMQTTTKSPVPLFAEENCYNNNQTAGGSLTNGICAPPADLANAPGGQWRQKGPYDLSGYAGQTVTLFLGVWSATTSTGYYDYALFDNVVVSGS